LIGAWVKPAKGQSAVAAVDDYEKKIGRKLDLVHSFYQWDDPWPTDRDTAAIAAGSTPLISWNGTDTREIASGKFDSMITERARAARDLKKPILMRWFWEMEGQKKDQLAGTPDNYIAAWRHVRGIFQREGATNVSWAWCPTSAAFKDGSAQPYYPGDADVDWICADGYSKYPEKAKGHFRSFGDVFGPFYQWAVQHNKPILVGEFGVRGPDDQRANWIRATSQEVPQQFPKIRALVYFDSPDRGDFELRDQPTALAAWSALVKEPYFNPRHVPITG
jgi:beta-mannanase